MRRRDVLGGLGSAVCLSLGSAIAFPARATPSKTAAAAHTGFGTKLAPVLRSIGGKVCLDMARRLDDHPIDIGSVDLHLRRAGLTENDALAIARALRSLTRPEAVSLRSFSMSYNPGLGDSGAAAVFNALPQTTREIGMVGCDLEDEAGRALLTWAQAAPQLRMICVEGNRFSDRMKSQMTALAERNGNLFIIV